MYPLKANGLDGMPPLFFQNFWSTSGVVVTKMVLDYRPISLCNVVYKIASKAITNRLNIYIYIYILPAIISDTQSALLYGRLTNNNVLVVFEIMHHIKQKK